METYTKDELFKIAEMIDNAYRPYTSGNIHAYNIISDIIENGMPKEEVEEETIPITYGFIRNTFGWPKFCDVTGGNHYMVNEWGHPDDSTIYKITISQAKELGIM